VKKDAQMVTTDLNEDTIKDKFHLAKDIARKMKHYAKEVSFITHPIILPIL
jgi:hypothetical protein